jgi:8-amino-7-oxononanoate synthase
MADEDFLDKKLNERKEQHAFRKLRLPDGATDLCSNDYLGIATGGLIETAWKGGEQNHSVGRKGDRGEGDSSAKTGDMRPGAKTGDMRPGSMRQAPEHRHLPHGSAGSRLLAGNYPLIEETEAFIAAFHEAETGLIFNSGYDANLGLLSSIPQRGDTILYDQLCHASIRDGIRLSFAHSFSFAHNDVAILEQRLRGARGEEARGNVFVVTESVFSMDGDQAPLAEIAALCRRYKAQLIVDEAHATGWVGAKGEGLVQALGLQNECLARVHTFGKAVGCHGAIVLGSRTLRDFLINFSRSLIYTTALPAASIWAIRVAYGIFPGMDKERDHLQMLIDRFQQAPIAFSKLTSRTPIQVVIVPGNEAAKALAARLQAARLDVRPILYPTVPRGSERLRIVLHSFNMREEVDRLIGVLK